ncbi:hypothetical protein [Microseira wollei]|uniref:hypothetical protein n=1 Tax=Microseira wollei TaxID=467598 RepID=UPI001CFCF82A|nr:hypothetical protein [Microseira wollei]
METRKSKPLDITPYWDGGTFEDRLDIPLDYPYSSSEWDSIFLSAPNASDKIC